MNLPNRSHKVFMDEIIRRGVLDFINHEKDDHQEEEEDSKTDTSILLTDE